MDFPKALPDETLFSRLVRHQMLSGLNAENYAYKIFGRKRIGVHPYLTIGIKDVSELTNEDTVAIFKEQTLGHFFSYFLPKYRNEIFSKLVENNSAATFRACQLPNFKQHERPFLKYCKICAREDTQNTGVAYWHLTYQIPGLETCPKHMLRLLKIKCFENRMFPVALLPDCNKKAEFSCEISREFSFFVQSYFSKISTMDYYSREALLVRLRGVGYGLGEHRIQVSKLTKDLYDLCQSLKHTSNNLLLCSPDDTRYLFFLLKGYVSQHPIKYLLLEFFLSKLTEEKIDIVPVKKNKKSDIEKISDNKCIEYLKKGLTLSEASRITLKSRFYLRGLAFNYKISLKSKPKIISVNVREKILALAEKGFHRKCIAERFEISTGSVEQIISSKPELVERRKRIKYESKRRRYKAQILREMQVNPDAIKQGIRLACSKAFFWLYRNEKEWLNLAMPRPLKPSPPPKKYKE